MFGPNPVFDLLDRPIVLGRGDEDFLVHDSTTLSHEFALDRVAKLSGILRLALAPNPRAAVRLDPAVDPVAQALAVLACARIGRVVVTTERPSDADLAIGAQVRPSPSPDSSADPSAEAAAGSDPDDRSAVGGPAAASAPESPVAATTAAPAVFTEEVSTRIPTHLEGLELHIDPAVVPVVDESGASAEGTSAVPGPEAEPQVFSLDALMRDARIESGAVVDLDPEAVLWHTESGPVTVDTFPEAFASLLP